MTHPYIVRDCDYPFSCHGADTNHRNRYSMLSSLGF